MKTILQVLRRSKTLYSRSCRDDNAKALQLQSGELNLCTGDAERRTEFCKSVMLIQVYDMRHRIIAVFLYNF